MSIADAPTFDDCRQNETADLEHSTQQATAADVTTSDRDACPSSPLPSSSRPSGSISVSPAAVAAAAAPKLKPNPIVSASFYAAQHPGSMPQFIAPALRPGRARRVALDALRRASHRKISVVPTQAAAFALANARPHLALRVWSFEITATGRRRYLTAPYALFWRMYSRALRAMRPLHFYEVIRERHAAKLYFDLEFLRAFNADLTPSHMVAALVDTCVAMVAESLSMPPAELKEITTLDSTTERKFSQHIVFHHVAFHDNVQMGDFVRRAVDDLCERARDLVLVRTGDGGETPFVDLGVYTRNRCFRLVGSSKFAKTARLLPVGTAQDRVHISRADFFRSLVCMVPNGTPLIGSTAPDEGGCGDDGAAAPFKRRRVDGGLAGGGASIVGNGAASPLRRLDEYVLAVVGAHGGGVHSVTMMAQSNTVIYTIKGAYKYCARIGRHHKSNNVMLIADVVHRLMYQKCFDPDCRGFRSEAWELPGEIFPRDDDGDEGEVDDFALVEMLDAVEAEQHDLAEVTDEVLNVAMDQYLGDFQAKGASSGQTVGT